MTITYELCNSLYINLTSRCTNNCTFCVRKTGDTVNGKDDLWFREREPTLIEIKKDLQKRVLTKYDEVVFCGFGEPFMRWRTLLATARWLKEKYDVKIRVNTNGQANLIANADITPHFEGVIDALSISLNASTPAKYQELCDSVFYNAFEEILDFTEKSKSYVKDITLSVVDFLSADEIDRCRTIADSLGVKFRVRPML